LCGSGSLMSRQRRGRGPRTSAAIPGTAARRPRLQDGNTGFLGRRRSGAGSLSPIPSSFLLLHEQQLGGSWMGFMALTSFCPPAISPSPLLPSSPPPLDCGGSKKENPKWLLDRERQRILGKKSPRGNADQGEIDERLYRAARLGFRADGWTSSGPGHPRLGHTTCIRGHARARKAATRVAFARPPASRWGRRQRKGKR
jgi:hypothetical protein